MSINPTLSVDPWCIREVGFDEGILGRTETLFSLANGHIGWRGTLDEGEPHELPGTYLNSVHELRDIEYEDVGHGDPETSQTVINVTDAKVMRLLVEDEPFSLQYGEVRHHERTLDFRKGELRRIVEWVSPTGQAVRVESTRLVSLTQRSVAAIHYSVEALETPVRVVVQSELVANEQMPTRGKDPRVAKALATPLVPEDHFAEQGFVGLVHITRRTGLRVGAAMDHIIDGPAGTKLSSDSFADIGRVTVTSQLQPGEKLSITKFVGYGWSARRSLPALRDQVAAALTVARHIGWEELRKEQENFLNDYWARADVELDGDAEIQQAVRFALFSCLQATVRAEQRAIPAKGLSGPGYDGHSFWDTEIFMNQVLNFTNPDAAADELKWRHSILPIARERAAELGLRGAAFAWRTIAGEECSGYWPAGTAQFHINADIADAVVRYLAVTNDEEFERNYAMELLAETARLWMSLGHHDLSGSFRIDGVTGPDEYTAIVDNNVYTNLMAEKNLRNAVKVAEKHPDKAAELGIHTDEISTWRAAAVTMFIPFDDVLGVHPQSEGFTRHDSWDFDNTPAEQYPLLLHVPYFDLYRKQVVKQSDLILGMFLCPDAFTDEQKLKNFEYYEKITVRDSSLSACSQSIIAAEVGHINLAYDYLAESAFVDLHDLGGNSRDGLHMASLAGTWMALVMGIGGLRQHNGSLSFTPRLPSGLTRLAFTITMRGSRLRVEVVDDEATYQVLEDSPDIEVTHYGDQIIVSQGKPGVYKIPPIEKRPTPKQPFGREPTQRHKGDMQDQVMPGL